MMCGVQLTYAYIVIVVGAVALVVGLYVAFLEGARRLAGIDLPPAIRFRFGLMWSGLPVLAWLERETILEVVTGPHWSMMALGLLGVGFLGAVGLVGLLLFRSGGPA